MDTTISMPLAMGLIEEAENRTKSREYLEKIANAPCINGTYMNEHFKYLNKYNGKVRDVYDFNDRILLASTDRMSCFDRHVASIPLKGQVLTQTSAWWFEKTKHIISNHVIGVPDPNVVVAKKCSIFPIEFVVRGYITGTTRTSLWQNYAQGVRLFCGNVIPEGLKKNVKLEHNIVTPTTKDSVHDESTSGEEIISKGTMTPEEWKFCSKAALSLFQFGQEEAAKRGLLLVDTKYEFGKDENGKIYLVDEIHTPDSSRYWIAHTYQERMSQGMEPDCIDKEFLRSWYKKNCDPYSSTPLPTAPQDLVLEVSRRYILLYELITGTLFQFPTQSLESRYIDNLSTLLPSS